MPRRDLNVLHTRPVRPAELRAVARRVPLAANVDSAHLKALCPDKTAGQAGQRLRRHPTAVRPIDAITTHCPETSRHVLLNVTFTPAIHAVLRHSAEQAGHTLQRVVERALHRELAQHDQDETERLRRALSDLLAGTTLTDHLAAVGQALPGTPGASP